MYSNIYLIKLDHYEKRIHENYISAMSSDDSIFTTSEILLEYIIFEISFI
jgi:hypothetical protein